MDYLDVAADRATAIAEIIAEPTWARPLLPWELRALCYYLVGTEMPVAVALRAMDMDVRRLTLDDLDRLTELVAHCRGCGDWAWLTELVQGRCPDCHADLEGARRHA